MRPLRLEHRRLTLKGSCQANHFRPPEAEFGFRLIVFFNCSHLTIQDIFVHFLRCWLVARGTLGLLGLSQRMLFELELGPLCFSQDPF